MEKRTYSTEMRNEDNGKIIGIASSVNSRYDLGWFEEEIAPGAFDEAMNDDVLVLFNHDANLVLGRTGSKTASIFLNKDGHLGYEYITPNRSFAKDVEDMIRTGDVKESSFAFTIKEEKWTWGEKRANGKDLRTITKIERLYDVSPVTYPANPNTSVQENQLRSIFDAAQKRKEEENTDITEVPEFSEPVIAKDNQVAHSDLQLNKLKLELLKL